MFSILNFPGTSTYEYSQPNIIIKYLTIFTLECVLNVSKQFQRFLFYFSNKKTKNLTPNQKIEMKQFVGKWHTNNNTNNNNVVETNEMIRFKSKCKDIYWLGTLS